MEYNKKEIKITKVSYNPNISLRNNIRLVRKNISSLADRRPSLNKLIESCLRIICITPQVLIGFRPTFSHPINQSINQLAGEVINHLTNLFELDNQKDLPDEKQRQQIVQLKHEIPALLLDFFALVNHLHFALVENGSSLQWDNQKFFSALEKIDKSFLSNMEIQSLWFVGQLWFPIFLLINDDSRSKNDDKIEKNLVSISSLSGHMRNIREEYTTVNFDSGYSKINQALCNCESLALMLKPYKDYRKELNAGIAGAIYELRNYGLKVIREQMHHAFILTQDLMKEVIAVAIEELADYGVQLCQSVCVDLQSKEFQSRSTETDTIITKTKDVIGMVESIKNSGYLKQNEIQNFEKILRELLLIVDQTQLYKNYWEICCKNYCVLMEKSQSYVVSPHEVKSSFFTSSENPHLQARQNLPKIKYDEKQGAETKESINVFFTPIARPMG